MESGISLSLCVILQLLRGCHFEGNLGPKFVAKIFLERRLWTVCSEWYWVLTHPNVGTYNVCCPHIHFILIFFCLQLSG